MDVEAAITDSDVRTSCSSHCEIITNVERCGLQICDLAMSGRITTILPGNGHPTALDTRRGLLVERLLLQVQIHAESGLGILVNCCQGDLRSCQGRWEASREACGDFDICCA